MKLLASIIVSVVATAIVAGGGIYFYLTKYQPPSNTLADKKTVASQEIKSHDVKISYDDKKENAIITNDGAQTGEIAIEEGELVKIIKQTQRYAYLEVRVTGIGGYILYEVNFPTYRLDLVNNKLEKIADRFGAISPTENLVAYSEYDNADSSMRIVMLDMTTKEKKTFAIPKEFRAAGNIHFSPNEQKIGFAASLSNPEDEASNVFTADIKSGKVTKLSKENIKKQIKIGGWTDNEKFNWWTE